MPLKASSSASRPSANAQGAAERRSRDDATQPSAAPLDDAEFAGLIARYCPVPQGAPVAVAVSGGGDSMALALLTAAWAKAEGRALTALTVDHRLRAESRAEAEQVGAWLSARGIAHVILTWDAPKPATGLQEAARDARYALIGAWAERAGIRHVMLAHQLEDQAETFLMRAARGSTIAGLAAMRAAVDRGGVRYLRPLLTVPRARLRATLQRANQTWIEDPSNESPRFARSAFRKLVARLAERGITPAGLSDLTANCARLDAHLDAAVRSFLGAAATHAARCDVRVDAHLWRALPEPIATLVLRRLLAEIGAKPQAPRSDRLARAYARLLMDDSAKPFTLGGCRITGSDAEIRIQREARPRRNKGFRGLSIAL